MNLACCMDYANTAGARGYRAVKLASHQKEEVTADAALFVFPVNELKKKEEDSSVIGNRFEAMFCFIVRV